MPSCSCPAISCGIFAGFTVVAGLVGFFQLRSYAPLQEGFLTYGILSTDGKSGTDFRTNTTQQSAIIDIFTGGDLLGCALFMDAASATTCDDVFAKLTVTFECSESVHDDCASFDSDVTPIKDCTTEFSKPDSDFGEDLPDKILKVATFKAVAWGKETNNPEVPLDPENPQKIRSTGDYRVQSESGVVVFDFWTGQLDIIPNFFTLFASLAAGLGLGCGGLCCLCAGCAYFMGSSPPPPGGQMQAGQPHGVQMQQPMM